MARNSVSVDLNGDEELKKKLAALKGMARGVLLDAAKDGAEIIRRMADGRAPGPHIEIGNEKVDGGVAEVHIGPDKEHWFYRFFEFGAGSHEIKGSPLVFEGDTKTVVTKKVNHPGMPAKPFLRNTAAEKKDETKNKIGEVFKRGINRITGGV